MPDAGWCRECGEWVWVDEQGGCQNGHGPECVEARHDAVAQNAEPGFGAGDMPDELARFNWGAFALPLVWAIVYGAWPITGLWLVSLVFPVFLSAMLGVDATESSARAVIAISVASEVVNGVVRLWAGANGNAMVWRREQIRLEILERAQPRFTVSKYIARQRVWAIAGWIALAIALVGTTYLNAVAWSRYGLTAYGAVEPALWLGAEIALGVYLARSMRFEPAEPLSDDAR